MISRANGITGWMVRNPISREANIVLEMYKVPLRFVLRHELQCRDMKISLWLVCWVLWHSDPSRLSNAKSIFM